jgi:hypothetical protein
MHLKFQVIGKENIIDYPHMGVNGQGMNIMKKITTILIIAFCLSLLIVPVIAANEVQGIHSGNTGKDADNKGQSHGNKNGLSESWDNSSLTMQTPEISRDGDRNKSPETSRNNSQIPGLKSQGKEEQGASVRNANTVPPGWEMNPNEVREGVHSLLAIENRTGGIGPQVSAIAREFNNSANASRLYENRIKSRDTLSWFFFGGDQQAATELANLTSQNQARINEIENLMNTTTLDAETSSVMYEQLQALQQNVAHYQQLSKQTKQDLGIFGWFWSKFRD